MDERKFWERAYCACAANGTPAPDEWADRALEAWRKRWPDVVMAAAAHKRNEESRVVETLREIIVEGLSRG